jgi:hypothetical protein
MKKKLLVIAAVFMLMFSFAGQAMATFSNGDLIEVIYATSGSGPEVAVDLGAFTSNITANSITDTTYSNALSLSTLFPGYSNSQLSVAYFVFNTSSSIGNTGFWVTGADGGQTNVAGVKSTVASSFTSVMGDYRTLSGQTASQIATTTGDLNSYYTKLDKSGLAVGQFAGFIAAGNAGEATLASSGYVDSYLYYYAYSTASSANSGVEIADIRTYADGHTEIIPVSSVPVPAAVWLLGSGLLSLIGIRRRTTVA